MVFCPFATSTDYSRASSLLHDATRQISLAASRSLQREDQQYILAQLHGLRLVSLAVAVLLQAGQSPLDALRLQEQGRSVTDGQIIDYRSEISDLMEQHPALGNDFNSLRQELDLPLRTPCIQSSLDDTIIEQLPIQQAAIRRRIKAATDLDDILHQIRQKPGFQAFMRTESEGDLLSAAQEGPIVVLNVTKLRSDAILLTTERVTSIALPDLVHTRVAYYFGKCGRCRGCRTMDDSDVKRDMLEWLWKAAVHPILRELGFYPKVVDPLPRIWWIGVGLMARAPIHAAAKFTKGAIKVKMTTLQYCLPSYTSTIRALQYSRSRQQYHQNASMLIVSMPTTPGAGPLGATKEADEIKHSLAGFSTVEILEKPTAECFLQALPSYSITHFACHGVSSVDPIDSHLLLVKASKSSDGLSTQEVDKLCIKDIAALKLPVARLAYLSACSTAHTSPHLADEVSHIVSSFHIAGFTNVIGTL